MWGACAAALRRTPGVDPLIAPSTPTPVYAPLLACEAATTAAGLELGQTEAKGLSQCSTSLQQRARPQTRP